MASVYQRLREALVMAWRAMAANKMRTLLTMLGIIIGIAAVIVMISIGMGVRKNITDSIASLGSNMLIVTPTRPTPAVCVPLPAQVRS